MIKSATLRELAAERLADAEVLFAGGRYDATVYICGYAVEFALKARICDALKWPGLPETKAEFQGKTRIKTHNFDVLLQLSGRGASSNRILFA